VAALLDTPRSPVPPRRGRWRAAIVSAAHAALAVAAVASIAVVPPIAVELRIAPPEARLITDRSYLYGER
jgi:hypothetical protein